jgi:hypothetical protein
MTEEKEKKDEGFLYFLNNQCGNSVKGDIEAEICLTLKDRTVRAAVSNSQHLTQS